MIKHYLVLSMLLVSTFNIASYAENSLNVDNYNQLVQQAENNDSNALYQLGNLYLSGQNDIQKDRAKAVKYLKKSADARHPEALYLLGMLSKEGQVVPQNFVDSYNYFVKSAEAGKDLAFYELGVAHDLALGVEQNLDKAREFYIYVAEYHQNINAMLRLAEMYEIGIGVDVDYDQAVYYYERLAKRFNHRLAKERLKRVSALNLLEKDVESGDEAATYQLAMRYFKGDDIVPQNIDRALQLLEDAAFYDSSKANYLLGKLYQEGRYLPQDHKTAYLKFLDSAEQQYLPSIFELAVYHLNGDAGLKDIKKGRELLNKAVKNGYSEAEAYQAFRDTKEKKYTQAFSLYRSAFKKGNLTAKLGLGELFFEGKGVNQNYQIAQSFFIDVLNSDGETLRDVENKAKAFFYLGRIYEEGLNGIKSSEGAFDSFLHSLRYQCIETMNYLKTLNVKESNYVPFLKAQNCLNESMSEEERYQYYRKAADNGFSLAQVILMINDQSQIEKYYQQFLETATDNQLRLNLAYYLYFKFKEYDKGLELFMLAAKQGNSEAQNQLGYFYQYGAKGITQDYVKAEQLYEKALSTKNKYLKAQIYYNLALLFYDRKDGLVDHTKFVDYLQKSASLQYPRAIHNLGIIFFLGRYVDQDSEKAIKYYQDAAELKYIPALESLYRLYYYGTRGVQKNSKVANQYLEELKQIISNNNLGQ